MRGIVIGWGVSTMAYLLPRTIAVLLVWVSAFAVLRHGWPNVEGVVFAAIGIVLLIGAIPYFAYLRKLHRDIAVLERTLGL